VIESRPVFEGRLISVHVDEVARADGTTASREVVRHPGAAAVVPLLPEGRVVMIRQYRHAAGRVLWELPAGTLDAGEAPEKCARRELVEEVGYEAGELSLLFSTYLSPGYSTELIHIFLARHLKEVAACAVDASTAAAWDGETVLVAGGAADSAVGGGAAG